MGNIHSVQKALENMGAKAIVSNKAEELWPCEKIVLPGVGAFGDAVDELKKRNLSAAIVDLIKEGKVFLGICLGMQLLFEGSQEAEDTLGLGILSGQVKKFNGFQVKVPHMGWNQLKITDNNCRLLKGIPDNSYVYFCHSYYPAPQDDSVTAATCDYGINFSAVVAKGNCFGAQFHPEKSQEMGLKMLKNFVDM